VIIVTADIAERHFPVLHFQVVHFQSPRSEFYSVGLSIAMVNYKLAFDVGDGAFVRGLTEQKDIGHLYNCKHNHTEQQTYVQKFFSVNYYLLASNIAKTK